MMDWLVRVHRMLADGKPVVRVVVASVRGSAPRDPGAVMLVGYEDPENAGLEGTIGGGHLEWKAIAIARTMLAECDSGGESSQRRVDRFSLGAAFGQCCGGVVELWFERFDARDAGFVASALERRKSADDALLLTSLQPMFERRIVRMEDLTGCGIALPPTFCDPHAPAAFVRNGERVVLIERLNPHLDNVWLFGAGHVGRALVDVLAALPLRTTWVDSREDAFSPSAAEGEAVTTLCADDPADAVRDAPADTFFVILTHSHDLDYAICRALLARGDFAWAGLIGSATKAASFKARLIRQGYSPAQVARIECPIGLPGIASKLPAAIAVSVAAQLLSVIEAHRATVRKVTPQPVVILQPVMLAPSSEQGGGGDGVQAPSVDPPSSSQPPASRGGD